MPTKTKAKPSKKNAKLPNYSLSSEDLLAQLKTSHDGLSKKEVAKRIQKYGLNEIKKQEDVKWYVLLLRQFTDLMVIILMVAMVISFFAHERLDAIAIAIIILINAAIGFSQEYKAEKAVEALKQMAAPHALVIRNKETLKIDATHLVPGDIIILEEGSKIPADSRLLELAQLSCIEASLTGESHPSKKHTDTILSKHKVTVGDRHNMVFMGTVVSQGHGIAVVTETGMNTEFGHIAHLVQTEKRDKTPLQKQLNKLSKVLAAIVMGVIAMLLVIALLGHKDLMEIFLLSISLAVSVIPEGLPAIITLTLALAVQKIAKKNAIIRKLPAAETLGSTSVICSDKTGTLTQNQMTIEQVVLGEQILEVTGVGYNPKGKIEGVSKLTKSHQNELNLLLQTAALCNNAKLLKYHKGKKKWDISGDPTEASMLTLAVKGGLDIHKENQKWKRKEELVFDSDRKRMSTINVHQKRRMLFSKGAPDAILDVCTHMEVGGKKIKITLKKRKELLKINEDLANKAYRVLALAYKPLNASEKAKEKDLIYLGLVAMMDPPREEVKAAIEQCHSANIDVKMITGDHALTARAIGEKIGLFKQGDEIITGRELEHMTERELFKRVEQIAIFARVSPRHKVKIVKALKKHGHIVAMTGDGVNDAPALKRADIGIAMGITGTDVSKEASEMILADDNFATIVETIKEGRVIYRNIKKFIRFLLSANFDEVLLISIIFIMGFPIPFLPLQILWVNLLTDALPAIALGTDVPDDDIMKLKPRDPNKTIWRELLVFSVFAGILSTAASLWLYFKGFHDYGIEHTRTMMFTMIVMFELFIVFSVRFAHRHYFTHFFKNKLLLFSVALSFGLQLMAIYAPFMQKILKTEPLTLKDWSWIIGLCILAVGILEIWKKFRKAPTHV